MIDPTAELATLRGWIGRASHGEDHLTPALVDRFRATLDDVDHPARPGDLAPPGLHWCLAPLAVPTEALGLDGHPAPGAFLPPVPLPRRMWAGGRVETLAPLRVGDAVQRTSTVRDLRWTEGRSGPLCFVTVAHEFRAGGTLAITEAQDLVFRQAAPTPGAPQPVVSRPSPDRAQWSRRRDADATLLFRYAALTFNAHRIHYDRRYCVEVEGYPGPVVQGALQATLLMGLAAEIRGIAPAHFAFRSTAPLFEGAPFTLNAIEEGGGLRLWTADEAGGCATVAEAQW